MQLAVATLPHFLLALGMAAFGWFMAFHSRSLISAVDILKPPKSETWRKVVVVWGYILMVVGCLCIAGYAIAFVLLLFQR